MIGQKQKRVLALGVYVLAFYAVWTYWELFAKPFLNSFGDGWGMQLLKSGLVKNLVWTLPAVLLIRHFDGSLFIGFRELFSLKVKWRKFLPVFGIFTAYALIAAVLKNGTRLFGTRFGVNEIIIVLFVGLTEETVFRGWLLNMTLRGGKQRTAVLVNAGMFLLIHFPVWIREGVFAANFADFGFVSVVMMSVIFSLSMMKSRSIWVLAALHSYWDLLMLLLIK